MFEFSEVIPEDYHKLRVDAVLAKLFPDYSRNQWIDWLRKGLIFHQEQPLSPKNKLSSGQIIYGSVPINIPYVKAPAQEMPLDIIYEDEFLLVINKPHGLVVHPGAGQIDATLMNALLYHDTRLELLPRAGIVHRLDKDTTGLMVIAKTAACYQLLVHAMKERLIKREYQALVHGKLLSAGTIHTKYGRSPKNRLKMAVTKEGKEAITHYQIAQKFAQHTLLRVRLETGRTHQIRVHLAYLGHSIVGDKLYGKTTFGQGVNFPRQALHACELKFIHPISQKELTFVANIPDDFELLLEKLTE